MKDKKRLQEMSRNLQKTGMRRRKKEVRNIRMMAMLSVIFLTLTLLFSENMKEYWQEMKFHQYGEWFMCQPDGFPEVSNAYLKEAGTIYVGDNLFYPQEEQGNGKDRIIIDAFKEEEVNTGIFFGILDSEAIKMGNIRMYEGRMPQQEDEIAMELSALHAFGCDYEIGQTVSVYLTKDDWGDKRLNDDEVELYRVDFRLVGTIKSYTANWSCGEKLPGAIVSAEAYEKMAVDKKSYTFLQIKEQYSDVDVQSLKEGIFAELDKRIEEGGRRDKAKHLGYSYNELAYADSFWGNQEMYRNMLLFLMITGVTALAYLMSSYLSKRRVFYYKLRSIGATTMQIRGMVLYECAYAVFLPSVLAIMLSYLLSVAVVFVVAMVADIPFFYAFHWRTLELVIGSVLAVLVASMATAVIIFEAKRIEEKRKIVSPRQLRRLGRRAARRKRLLGSGEFLCRERLRHPFSLLFHRLLGILVCTVILCCMAKIYEAVRWYDVATVELVDYSIWAPQTEVTISAEEIAGAVGGDIDHGEIWQIKDMKNVLPDSLLTVLEEQMGVQSIRYLTRDETHIFDWKDKQKSVLWKKTLSNQVKNKILNGEKGLTALDELLYMDIYSTLYYKYEDCKPLWKKLKKYLDLDIADYDKICEGKQVILFLNDYENDGEGVIHQGDVENEDEENKTEERRETVLALENTLRAGDTLQIRTKGGPVSVEIAGILDFDELSGYSGSAAYNIVGSEALGRAVAGADGIEFGYTDLRINLNRFASGEGTGKVITRLCTLNDLEYWCSMETLDYCFQNLIQKIFIYGTLAVIILVIYLFISFCIHQEERRKKEAERQQLHLMGMSAKKLRQMEWREGLQEGAVLWISVLFFGIVQGVQILKEWGEFEEEVVRRHIVILGKDTLVHGVREYVFYNLLDSLSVWWLIVFLLGMMAVMALLHIGRKADGA